MPKEIVKRQKKSTAVKFCYGDVFFEKQIIPFLDEWTLYNLSLVNESFRKMVDKCELEFKNLSLLSHFFKRENMCCICFKKIPNRPHIVDGMYLHIKCKPKISQWFVDMEETTVREYDKNLVKPGDIILSAYEEPNPCFIDSKISIDYYLQNRKTDTKYSKFFDIYYKKEEFNIKYDKSRNVYISGIKFNVFSTLLTMEPKIFETNTVNEIVEKCQSLENKMVLANDIIGDYYSKVIKPNILYKRTPWYEFLYIGCPGSRTFNVRTMMLKNGVISNPKSICPLLKSKLNHVIKLQLRDLFFNTKRTFSVSILCECPNCRLILKSLNDYVVYEFIIPYLLLKYQETKELLKLKNICLDIFEKMIKFWMNITQIEKFTKVNTIWTDSYSNKEKNVFEPLLRVIDDDDKVERINTLYEELIANYKADIRDITSSVLRYMDTHSNNLPSTKETSLSSINYIVRNRKRCLCRNSNIITPSTALCQLHRLCTFCCQYEICKRHVEESSDSSSDTGSNLSSGSSFV